MATAAEVQAQLDDLLEHGEGLTSWEADFLGNLEAKLRDGRPPTDKQADKVAQIHADRMPKER